jgi:hypothetical protein
MYIKSVKEMPKQTVFVTVFIFTFSANIIVTPPIVVYIYKSVCYNGTICSSYLDNRSDFSELYRPSTVVSVTLPILI